MVPRGWISRAEIEALAQGRVPLGPRHRRLQRADAAAATSPRQGRARAPTVRPPEALIEAARRALEAQPHAVAGWLFATVPASGPPQLMVGVAARPRPRSGDRA